MSAHEELEPMLSAFLDGELSAGESSRVSEHVACCAACREELAFLRSAAALIASREPDVRPAASWGEVLASRDERRAVRAPERRRIGRAAPKLPWPLWAAAAAGVALAAGLAWRSFAPAGVPGGSVVWSEGALEASAGDASGWIALRQDEPVLAGTSVRTAAGRAEIELAGGVRIEMNRETEIRLAPRLGRRAAPARSFSLRSGEVCCRVTPGYGEFRVEFPSGAVTVTGTEFDVCLAPGGSAEVTTLRGSVLVSASAAASGGAGSVSLPEGMSVTAETGSGLSPARRESVSAASSWRRDDYRRELAESLLSRRHIVPELPEGERLVLADFESESDLLIFGDSHGPGGSARLTGELRLDRAVFCHGSAAASFPVEGNLSSLKYPGVRSLPRDLSGWRWLRFEVYNPVAEPVWAELMMKDAPAEEYDARYNRSFVLDPGWNTVEVNLEALAAGRLDRSLREYGRAVDPSNVHHLVFSVPRERMPAELAGHGVVVDFFRLDGPLAPVR